MTIQNSDEYSTELRKLAVDLILPEERAKQDRESQPTLDDRLSYASIERSPQEVERRLSAAIASGAKGPHIERLVREQMGLPSTDPSKYLGSRNEALDEMWRQLADIDKDIQDCREARENCMHPELVEQKVRARMGVSKSATEERGRPGQFPHFMHRLSYAVDYPEEEEKKPTLEDAVRQQMGLRKLEKQ